MKGIMRSVVIIICLAAVTVVAQQADLTGVWTGSNNIGKATFALQADGSYSFQIVNTAGQTQGTNGTYQVQGNMIVVRINQTGQQQQLQYQMTGPDSMVLTAGQVTFNLTRSGSGQQSQGGIMGGPVQRNEPVQKPNLTNRPQRETLIQRDTPNFQTYNHHAGFKYDAPDSWNQQKSEMVMILTPPNAQMINDEPQEGVIVYAEQAPGITDAMDQQVETYFNGQVAKIFPYLKPAGKNQTKSGAVYYYGGRSPHNIDMTGQLYVKLENNVALVSFGVCPTNNISKFESIFYMINATSTVGGNQGGGQMTTQPNNTFGGPGGGNQQGNALPTTAPQGDGHLPQQNQNAVSTPAFQGGNQNAQMQQLVGFWYYIEEESWEGGYSRTWEGVDLRADGTWEMANKSEDKDDSMSQPEVEDWEAYAEGKWRVENGLLVLWDDSDQEISIRFEMANANSLILYDPEEGKAYTCQRGTWPLR